MREEVLRSALVRLLSEPICSPLCVWEVVCEVADGFDLGERSRHFRGELRRFAEVYLSVFRPSEPWSFAEVPTEPPALWWSSDFGVFCDFVVVGGPGLDPWSLTVRPSGRRLVDAGRERFAERFLGVRVVVPAAPGRSLFVTDRKAPPVRLLDTSLWFGTPLTELRDLVAAGQGGEGS